MSGKAAWPTLLWRSLMGVLCVLGVCTGAAVWAQERPGLNPLGRPGLPPLPQLEDSLPTPPPGQILPPLPPPPPEEEPRVPQEGIVVQQIRVTGSTVFTEAELASVTTPYVNRKLATEDLEALRLALTRLYVNAGYINSGAVIPSQTVSEGVLTLQVIEGVLTDIEVTGTRWFRPGYIRRRLALGAGPPLKLSSLQERLQLLQQDDRIAQLQAELKAGVQRGESVLSVQVEENSPFKVELAFNNYQSPTVGGARGLITLAHQNLTGHGDILSVTYGRSEGIDVQLDTSYTVPLTARDTSLSLRYRRNPFTVIEAAFAPLDIESLTEAYSITLRHPFSRTLSREFAIVLSAERQYNETFLLGEPFSFSLGAEDGKSTVTAIRVALEWTDRTPTQVLALRSRFTVGIDALGATIHEGDVPDGRFVAWLGQAQAARQLTDWGLQAIARLDVQLASNPLLSLEQLAVGGRFSVRGYRENQLVRDNGIIASLEVRLPLVRNKPWADVVQLAPFVDVGTAWNTKVRTLDPRTLTSIGVGLRWALTLTSPVPLRPEFEIYWGYPLRNVETDGGDLQDLGVHLQLVIAAF